MGLYIDGMSSVFHRSQPSWYDLVGEVLVLKRLVDGHGVPKIGLRAFDPVEMTDSSCLFHPWYPLNNQVLSLGMRSAYFIVQEHRAG